MTIIEALKDVNSPRHIRVSCGDRWLVRSEGEWVVYEQKYRQNFSREIIRTANEDDAVATLCG